MANTVDTTVFDTTVCVTGPRDDLDRFAAPLLDSMEDDALEAHVPLTNGETPTQAWGTRWVYKSRYVDLGTRLELTLETPWNPPLVWFEKVAALFPALTFELFFASHGDGEGGAYIRAEQGRVSVGVSVEDKSGPFVRGHGRPGFFVPYWETPEGEPIPDADPNAPEEWHLTLRVGDRVRCPDGYEGHVETIGDAARGRERVVTVSGLDFEVHELAPITGALPQMDLFGDEVDDGEVPF